MPDYRHILILILFCLIFLFGNLNLSESQSLPFISVPPVLNNSTEIDKIKTSIFIISSEDKKSCGTAFLSSDNTLYTSNHIIELILKKQNLSSDTNKTNENFSLLLKDAFNSEKTLKISFSNLSQISSLDIVKIKLQETPASKSYNIPSSDSVYKADSSVFAVGFKNCEEATLIKGTIIQETPIWLESNLEGYFGMSGSPVFSTNGEFIGLIDQAHSIIDGILGRIFGSSFSLRVTKASALKFLDYSGTDSLNLILSLKNEAELINKNYQKNLLELSSYSRLIKSLEFFSQKKLFFQRLSNYPEIKPDLTPLIKNETKVDLTSIYHLTTATADKGNQNETNLLETTTNELNEQIALLSIYNAYETYGSFNGANFENNNIASFKNKLNDLNISINLKENLLSFIESTKKQSYPGYEAMVLSSSLLVVFITILVSLWFLTIGYVLGDYKKGFWSKLWITFVVGFFLWPISFVVYLLFVRKKIHIV